MKKLLTGFLILTALLLCLPLTAMATADTVECWRMHEITFYSQEEYADPLGDAVLDVAFTGPGGGVMTMPGFWDGGGSWRVRFAPTQPGLWQYESTCSNAEDAGLHGQSGSFECVPYTGDLEIYRRGFLKAEPGVRYLMYADGTPFFYLGDTHWTMPKEPFDEMFKTVVDTRAEQGFTVYQSQPHCYQAESEFQEYNLRDGLDEGDLAGFADLDRRFAYIADTGLVHANSHLFYVTELADASESYPGDYLRQLSRYWVARYGAYPVLWFTAQEADDDYYGAFDAENNPWKIVAAETGACDPYRHPLTAHQEAASMAKKSDHGMNASKSAFGLPAHTWWGVQWSPSLYKSPDFSLPKDFWDKGGGKPVINFEGRYDFFWTKHFGARAQGWISFLNGMFGYGYGAIDIWTYGGSGPEWEEIVNNDRVDKITPEDKAIPWTESLYFETADQMGICGAFEGMEWWNLTPRFNSWRWFIPSAGVNYSLASQGNDVYVAYFYQRKGRATGILRGLGRDTYTPEWFNPRTGETEVLKNIRPFLGMAKIPGRPDKGDWVFCLRRASFL